jgi:hypothetical protein
MMHPAPNFSVSTAHFSRWLSVTESLCPDAVGYAYGCWEQCVDDNNMGSADGPMKLMVRDGYEGEDKRGAIGKLVIRGRASKGDGGGGSIGNLMAVIHKIVVNGKIDRRSISRPIPFLPFPHEDSMSCVSSPLTSVYCWLRFSRRRMFSSCSLHCSSRICE